jgi:hypothetical protein
MSDKLTSRTFPQIAKELYIKKADYIHTTKHLLFDILDGSRYDELYNMPKGDLFWLITDQFEFIKCHTIIPIDTMTKSQLVYVASYNNELMKLPNCGQKKFFKNNQDIMKEYEKNNKLKNGKTYKESRSRRITMY